MLKNTKFLYCIIAVLLTVCILCGIHIAKDYKMTQDNRYLLVNHIAAHIDAASAYSKEVLSYEYKTDDFDSSLAWTKNSLELASQKLEFLSTYYPHSYNIITSYRDFIFYSNPDSSFYPYSLDWLLSGLVYEAEMMINYYEENGNLKDEHILWLETLSSSAEEFIEEVTYEDKEGKYHLEKKYYKNDKEFCYSLSDFLDKMYSVSIR